MIGKRKRVDVAGPESRPILSHKDVNVDGAAIVGQPHPFHGAVGQVRASVAAQPEAKLAFDAPG